MTSRARPIRCDIQFLLHADQHVRLTALLACSGKAKHLDDPAITSPVVLFAHLPGKSQWSDSTLPSNDNVGIERTTSPPFDVDFGVMRQEKFHRVGTAYPRRD